MTEMGMTRGICKECCIKVKDSGNNILICEVTILR